MKNRVAKLIKLILENTRCELPLFSRSSSFANRVSSHYYSYSSSCSSLSFRCSTLLTLSRGRVVSKRPPWAARGFESRNVEREPLVFKCTTRQPFLHSRIYPVYEGPTSASHPRAGVTLAKMWLRGRTPNERSKFYDYASARFYLNAIKVANTQLAARDW